MVHFSGYAVSRPLELKLVQRKLMAMVMAQDAVFTIWGETDTQILGDMVAQCRSLLYGGQSHCQPLC